MFGHKKYRNISRCSNVFLQEIKCRRNCRLLKYICTLTCVTKYLTNKLSLSLARHDVLSIVI